MYLSGLFSASVNKSYRGPLPLGVDITINLPCVSGEPTLGLSLFVISCNVSCEYSDASSATHIPTLRPLRFSFISADLHRMNTPFGNLIVSSELLMSFPSRKPKCSIQLCLSGSQMSDLIIDPVGAL